MQSSSASVSKSVLRRRGIKIKVRCRSARQEPWWSCAAHRLVRPGNRLQGDLFQDSAKTIALDAVNRALAEHRFDAGRSALEQLSELPNTHVLVNDYLRLIRAATSARGTSWPPWRTRAAIRRSAKWAELSRKYTISISSQACFQAWSRRT